VVAGASTDKDKIAALEVSHADKDKEIEAHKKELASHKEELEKLKNQHENHVSKTDTVIKNRIAENNHKYEKYKFDHGKIDSTHQELLKKHNQTLKELENHK
jgi:hypothetical protein